jgi:DNA-binding transcriptional LysR family regulator
MVLEFTGNDERGETAFSDGSVLQARMLVDELDRERKYMRGLLVTPRFDLSTLKIFVAVAEHKNITKAARHQHIAPSAVSKRLANLEQTIRSKLFYRKARGVELTATGSTLLYHATTILESVDKLADELNDVANGTKGHVRIRVNKSAMVQFLPQQLQSFTAKFPDVKIELFEQNSGAIIKAIQDGQSDIGLYTAGSISEGNLETFDYATDEMTVVLAKDHPLAGRKSLKFRETLTYDFIGLGIDSAWDALLRSEAARLSGTLRVRFHVTSLDAGCQMVGAKLGITIAPKAMVEAFRLQGRLVSIRLAEPWAVRQLKIAVRDSRSLSVAAQCMVKHLQASLPGTASNIMKRR